MSYENIGGLAVYRLDPPDLSSDGREEGATEPVDAPGEKNRCTAFPGGSVGLLRAETRPEGDRAGSSPKIGTWGVGGLDAAPIRGSTAGDLNLVAAAAP